MPEPMRCELPSWDDACDLHTKELTAFRIEHYAAGATREPEAREGA